MAAPIPPTRGTSGPQGVIPAEWPAQAADTIVETIAKVRDRTTKPAITAARAVVYGLIVVIVGTIAAVLTVILVFRVLSYLPGPMWTVYAVFAVVFSVAGFVLLHKANRPAEATPPDA